jgi:hypothetical protein
MKIKAVSVTAATAASFRCAPDAAAMPSRMPPSAACTRMSMNIASIRLGNRAHGKSRTTASPLTTSSTDVPFSATKISGYAALRGS